MPDRPTSHPEQFVQCAAVLQVTDVLETTNYYRDMLGFNCDYVNAEYGIVWRDNSAIHFARSAESPTGVRLFNWLNNVDSYYDEIKSRGANITVDIGNRDYGIRDFTIDDINSVMIDFGQDQ